MINSFIRLGTIGIGVIVYSFFPNLVFAQIQFPSNAPSDINQTNIDDLPNNVQQMTTWGCRQQNQFVSVEVKDVTNWQEVIETNGWQCAEQLSAIPDNSPQFSCESNNGDINIITTTWLTGTGGKQQMQSWIKAFQDMSMTCTTDETNPFWN